MGLQLALDEYAHLNSPLHRWAAKPKLIGLLAIIFAFASVRQVGLLLPMLGITVGLYAVSQLPLRYLQRRLRYPGLFILGVVAVLPWFVGETVVAQWGWLSLRQEGLGLAVLVVGRFLSIVITTFVLLGTTPFVELLQVLRTLGLPPLLADMMLLSYRYLYDTAATVATMQQAMGLRGFGSGRSRGLKDRLGQLASLTGTLLIRSYEQSERVYRAMRLRGYGQAIAVSPTADWGSWRDGVALGLALGAAAGLIVVELRWF